MKTKTKVSNVDQVIGSRIHLTRVLKGLSQKEIGLASSVSIQQIQKYEQGINRVSVSMLLKIAKALQVEPSYLYSEALDKAEEALKAVTQAQNKENEKLRVFNKSFLSIKNTKIKDAMCQFMKALSDVKEI